MVEAFISLMRETCPSQNTLIPLVKLWMVGPGSSPFKLCHSVSDQYFLMSFLLSGSEGWPRRLRDEEPKHGETPCKRNSASGAGLIFVLSVQCMLGHFFIFEFAPLYQQFQVTQGGSRCGLWLLRDLLRTTVALRRNSTTRTGDILTRYCRCLSPLVC